MAEGDRAQRGGVGRTEHDGAVRRIRFTAIAYERRRTGPRRIDAILRRSRAAVGLSPIGVT